MARAKDIAESAWSLAKETVGAWNRHHAPRLAAALAYYTLLSLAPLVVIAISIAGLAFGDEAARGQMAEQLGAVVGAEAARGIQAIVSSARSPEAGVVGTVVGVVVLLFGASGVFGELQATLDVIWDVLPKPGRGVWGTVKDRFVSFTMVLGVAFLLLVSLIVSAALSATGRFFESSLPGGEVLWQLVNAGISLGTVTLLFGLIFKVVPDVEVAWKDVWPGAFITAVLFTLGKFALGLYLGKSTVASSYGAAGSLVALAVWVYYAAQILFFGAEFTRAQAARRGHVVRPDDDAVRANTSPDAEALSPSP